MRSISKYLERSYWGFDDSFMVLAVVSQWIFIAYAKTTH
jgi:hypothetical protein